MNTSNTASQPHESGEASQDLRVSLQPEHFQYLLDEAIAHDVIVERGYCTIGPTLRLNLLNLGFKRYQARCGILLPQWNVHRELAGFQLRPNNPRVDRKGRAIKYETPFRQKPFLDCHPRMQPQLRDPAVDLFISEGTKKIDALASAGVCAVSISGVWAWRIDWVAVIDWDSVALKRRRIFLWFDTDVLQKESVYKALNRLKSYLQSRDANVSVILPETCDGGAI